MKIKYCLMAVIFQSLCVPAVFGAQASHLFFVARNKNANIIRYDALMDTHGKIDPREPVTAYWILLAKDGRRQELTALDRKAYGFSCTPDKNPGVYNIIIKSFNSREIRVYNDKRGIKAEVAINGKPAWLNEIFIDASQAIVFTKVHYIELFGKDKTTGAKVYEKIIP